MAGRKKKTEEITENIITEETEEKKAEEKAEEKTAKKKTTRKKKTENKVEEAVEEKVEEAAAEAVEEDIKEETEISFDDLLDDSPEQLVDSVNEKSTPDDTPNFVNGKKVEAFSGYDEYMRHVFHCVNMCLSAYMENMKLMFSNGQGGYKNVLYPDLEIASDSCSEQLEKYEKIYGKTSVVMHEEEEKPEMDLFGSSDDEDEEENFDDELLSLLGAFAETTGGSDYDDDDDEFSDIDDDYEEGPTGKKRAGFDVLAQLQWIGACAELTYQKGEKMPFYELTKKLEMRPFALFTFASGVLSSTQTDYASIFQIINENGNLSSPTIESAAKIFFGPNYSITGAYGEMSECLEALLPILDLRVISSMPFSTVISPDKRIIDYLFGKDPMRLDENYIRFFKMLTTKEELDPIMANDGQLEAMKISYGEGVRIFSYYGDEGSGRKFFIRHFCDENNIGAVSINCKKLFVYDFNFVEKALWAVTRECILTNSCCCLDELTFREDEKEKFYGYMDLAFNKLTQKSILVFAISREKLAMRDITKEEVTELEIPTPNNAEREKCWNYFSQKYKLDKDVDQLEMATKFLFTPGKIKSALHSARSLATMNKEILISRATLFQGCYGQMSSELTQKATKIKANFGFEDIVMNKDQRETLEHAIDQMNFRKQVYDGWHYTKKYPYGRGLSILLFGAPGTGKSMCAQVIAHELNLELYRVDLSKVIDKYVGETEKSISMIFREAKKCNVVLFFDECDTLFAKRSDDGGSNQASNNNKTALLLQEVEGYDGVSVLATNYKHNIDPAFFRRMKYIVEFQFPDVDTREMLWRTTIPKDTPLAEDVDIRYLAEKYELVGGNIKNCILNAAFLAAADPAAGGQVHMVHYLLAVKYEFVKVGKVFTRADFEPYADAIFGTENKQY